MSTSPLLTAADPDVTDALERLNLPQLQVAEALAALGASVPMATLTLLLTGDAQDDRVASVVRELCTAVLCTCDDSVIGPVAGLRTAFGRPLGLGPTLAESLGAGYADDVRRIARHLGLPSLGRKETTLGPVVARMSETGVIQSLLADAPDGVIDAMINLAWCEDGPQEPARFYDNGDDWDPEFRMPSRYRDDSAGPSRWGLGHDHAWARERGLVVSRRDDGRPDLPAEVAMALRGPDYRAPFEPDRPVVRLRPSGEPTEVSVGAVDRVTAPLWLRLARLCVALLHESARKPLPRRKSGELTDPELKRLAGALDATVDETRVLLVLARAAGLVVTDSSLLESARRAAWLDAEIPERAAILARQLCDLPRPVSADDRFVSRSYSWSPPAPSADVRRLRLALLGVLAELPPGERTQVETIRSVVRWDAPRTIGADSEALESLWREASATGLIVNGALSAVGRALTDSRSDQLASVFAALMPALVDEALISTELTATVAGLPTRRVSQVLDAMAERDCEDAETGWRFTSSSVRRAFDDGGTEASLLAGLSAVSCTPLPGALTRLIADIARRHGHLRVLPVGAIISSADETLLAELQRSSGLAALDLQPLAPGMLMAAVSHDMTLEVLRSGGYLPVSALRAVECPAPSGSFREPVGNAQPTQAPRETSRAT